MLTPKFVRSHFIPTGANGFQWFFKLIYEFWGFCVNGGNDTVNPGGFSPSTGVYQMPWAPYSSSAAAAGLLASGSDGFTHVGLPFFNSINQNAFSASYVNRWLVTWQSGSTSTDDSVYQITQWINSASLRVNMLTGGTPYTGSLKPSFTERSQVLWRIVDFATAAALPVTQNVSSLVLQFNAAADVNPGQALSQVRLKMALTPPGYSPGAVGVGFTLSPSGTWHGNTAFDSGSYSSGSIVSGTFFPTGTFTPSGNLVTASFFNESIPEIYPGSVNGGYWFGVADNPAYITLIGAQDFLIAHFKGQQALASGFHIEIPQRVYPQGVDPNPLAVMGFGVNGLTSTDTNNHYAGGFFMHNPPSNLLVQYKGYTRRFFGRDDSNSPGTQTNGRYNGSFFNTYLNKFNFVDVVLGSSAAGQYQPSRCRLRRVRILPPIVPQFERLGNLGEWLHVQNGVLWPWDNTLLPYNLFQGGN